MWCSFCFITFIVSWFMISSLFWLYFVIYFFLSFWGERAQIIICDFASSVKWAFLLLSISFPMFWTMIHTISVPCTFILICFVFFSLETSIWSEIGRECYWDSMFWGVFFSASFVSDFYFHLLSQIVCLFGAHLNGIWIIWCMFHRH